MFVTDKFPTFLQRYGKVQVTLDFFDVDELNEHGIYPDDLENAENDVSDKALRKKLNLAPARRGNEPTSQGETVLVFTRRGALADDWLVTSFNLPDNRASWNWKE